MANAGAILRNILNLVGNVSEAAATGKVPESLSGKQREWKPTTKEEAIQFELAKLKPEKKDDIKDFEQGIKRKIASGEGLSQNEASYANRFMRKSGDINDFESSNGSSGDVQQENGSSTESKDKLGILGKIITAIKGSAGNGAAQKQPANIAAGTGDQSNAVSPLRKILNFYGPASTQSAVSTLPAAAMAQSAAQKLSSLVNSGKAAQGRQSQAETGKSPYSDYPDAFKENGVWKVVRNGKKYRLEE